MQENIECTPRRDASPRTKTLKMRWQGKTIVELSRELLRIPTVRYQTDKSDCGCVQNRLKIV